MAERPYEGMTAVLYARVSTDDKGQTVESQIREMKAWCERESVTIIEIYSEEQSAADLDRPEFDRCMGRIMRGGVNILLAWQESRISRSMEDMTNITRILSTFNTVIRYVSSSAQPEVGAGKLINTINTWQAEEERKKLSLNTKNGMLTAKLNGVHCGRPLKLCFLHKLEENKAKIREGVTVVTPIDFVLDCAREGCSIPYTAKNVLHVSKQILYEQLKAEGYYEQYNSLYEEAKKTVRKGVSSERVEITPENSSERGEVA